MTGASGGVGCTSLAVNLGTTLAQISGQETILVDLDLMLGSVDACLDIITDTSLLGLVQNIDRLDLTLLKRRWSGTPRGSTSCRTRWRWRTPPRSSPRCFAG